MGEWNAAMSGNGCSTMVAVWGNKLLMLIVFGKMVLGMRSVPP